MKRPRSAPRLILAAAMVALLGLAASAQIAAGAQTSAASRRAGRLSIRIVKNHFVNASGKVVRLLGVGRPGTEYACEQGWAYSQGDTKADAAAVASWHADAVRVPLNEDCWLGINGQPSYRPQGTSETAAQSAGGYRAAVESYVRDLNADHIYAILDLHWSAPGSGLADGQRPMADAHAIAFWKAVASTFKNNPAVVFDAFNEPYSPADDWSDASRYPLSWNCWLKGGCTLTAGNDSSDPGPDPATYTAVGMQSLIDAIRATGAAQPILVGGLSYANDLSGWLAHRPRDPGPHGHPGRYPQIAASFHNYQGETNDTVARWNAVIAKVAAKVPVVTGEFDQNECNSHHQVVNDGWDLKFMDWADRHGVSYLAWGWYVNDPPTCSNYSLDSGDGTPAPGNGVALYDHLKELAK